jgi:hypothetical protein
VAQLLSLGHANVKTDEHLQNLDKALSPRAIQKFIAKEQSKAAVSLAMEEDLNAEYPNYYLLSDDMLNLFDKEGILTSPFAHQIEAFQAHVDSLKNEEEKAMAISAWKSLWLDKVSEYQVFLKSLKKRVTFDLSQDFNYDSNIKVLDNDQNSGLADSGASFSAGLNWKPFINNKKSMDWRYAFRLSGRRTLQTDENDVQYDYLTWSNRLSYANIAPGVSTLSFNLSGTYGFQKGDGAAERFEYSQYALGSSVSFLPFKASHITFGHFKSGVHKASLRIRFKDEAANTASGILQEDVNILTLTYGQMYSQVNKTQPFQILGWNVSIENQEVDIVDTRDYTYLKLGTYYIRNISSLIENSNLTWNSRVSLRLKDWSNSTAGTRENEFEYYLSTGVSNAWTGNFSTSLDLSYRNRSQDLNNATDQDIEQWRIVLSNSFLTF